MILAVFADFSFAIFAFFSYSFSTYVLFAIQLIISGPRAWHKGLYPTAEVVRCEGHCDTLLERKDLWYHQRIFTKQCHKDLCCLYCYWQEYLEQRSIWAQISFRSETGAANLNVESRVKQQAWSNSQKEQCSYFLNSGAHLIFPPLILRTP